MARLSPSAGQCGNGGRSHARARGAMARIATKAQLGGDPESGRGGVDLGVDLGVDWFWLGRGGVDLGVTGVGWCCRCWLGRGGADLGVDLDAEVLTWTRRC
eukprot:1179541-Prorocentrum_minimum.AAC.3